MSEAEVKRKKTHPADMAARVKKFVYAHILTDTESEGGHALQRSYTARVLRLAAGLIFCILLSRTQLALSIYPFGIIFLCSTARATPLYTVGAVIGSLMIGGVSSIYAAVCTLVLVARSFVCVYIDTKHEGVKKLPVYNEWTAYRVIVSCVASFIIGVYDLFYFGSTYYSLLGSLLIMAVCPLGVYIFSSALDIGASKQIRDAGRLVMCAVLVWSLQNVSPLGVELGRVAAFCLVSNEAAKNKGGAAALMGLVCAIPYGLSSCAIYALTGALGAVLGTLSPFLGRLGMFTFAVMAEGYIGGYSALTSALPSLSLGLCISIAYQNPQLREKLSYLQRPSVRAAPKQQESRESSLRSMEEISLAFSSLSKMLKDLSSSSGRRAIIDTQGICEESCDTVCADCPKRTFCWEKNASATSDAMAKVSRTLAEKDRISSDTMPRYLRVECDRSRQLCSEINRRLSEQTQSFIRSGNTELFAADYDAMAQILSSHMKNAQDKQVYDEQLSEALYQLSKKKMYGIGAVSVYGKRHKEIYAHGIDLASHTVSAAELCESFSSVCGCRLTSPVYSIDGSDIELEMHTTAALSVNAAIATLTKEGEGVSGDCADTLKNSDGYFYGILCDGMGSGKQAAYTSGICTEYLHNMLSCANPKELTVEMLNAVIKEDGCECSSTVDLFELDTYNGNGCFLKSGAAPSFVCRQKNVYRISARSIPIGIVDRIGAEKIKFRVRAGDIVVMVSDGVVESADEGRLVVEALCKRTSSDPFDIAASVLAAAKSKYDRRDDMTVIAMCIEKE